MDTNGERERGRAVRAAQVACAVLVVLALAGLTAVAWYAQGRNKEDTTAAIALILQHNADVARSLLPLVDRLDILRGTVANLQPGTPEYQRFSQELTELQNIIGDAMPALVYRRDAAGNATLAGVEMVRKHLDAQIKAARNP
jgi:hypothetical protein